MLKRNWVLFGLMILNLSVFTNTTDVKSHERSLASQHGSGAFRSQPRKERSSSSLDHATPSEEKLPWYKRIFKRSPSEKTTQFKRNGDQYPGSTASVDRYSKITGQHFIDARYLDTAFKGNLRNRGHAIIQAALRHGLDPVFFAAIMAQETGWGTSSKVRNQNNPGGLTVPNKPMKYESYKNIEAGIEAMAKRLKSRYLDRNLTTISSIAAVYAPVGARNDPKKRNKYWPGGVASIMNRMIAGSLNMGNQKSSGKNT